MHLKLTSTICAAALSFAVTGLQAQTNLAKPSASEQQTLRFYNGDVFLGTLDSISADKSVGWLRRDVATPMHFSGTNLAEIKLTPAKKATATGTNVSRITLRNGDWLEGNLVHLDADDVALETTFAGKLVFPRSAVESLEPLPPEHAPIFTGPDGLEGWTMGRVTAMGAGESGVWSYTNNAFYATLSASIARDVKLPPRARVQFDLAWKGMLQTAIALYTSHLQPINLANKELEPDFGGFYSLQLNSFMATLMPVKKNDPLKYLGQIAIPTLAQKKQAHIEILADKSRASVALLINGMLVKEWIDPEGFAGSGTAMRFVQQGGQGTLKLSNLKISEWNGKMPEKSTNIVSTTEDMAKLLNGDKVSGKLESAEGGEFTFLTGGSKLQIPFERVNEVYFEGKTVGSGNLANNEVRAFLNGGGRITFKLERGDNQTVTGTSDNFGKATISSAALERIQLNPDAQPK